MWTCCIKSLLKDAYAMPHTLLFALPFVELEHKQMIEEEVRELITWLDKDILSAFTPF